MLGVGKISGPNRQSQSDGTWEALFYERQVAMYPATGKRGLTPCFRGVQLRAAHAKLVIGLLGRESRE